MHMHTLLDMPVHVYGPSNRQAKILGETSDGKHFSSWSFGNDYRNTHNYLGCYVLDDLIWYDKKVKERIKEMHL